MFKKYKIRKKEKMGLNQRELLINDDKTWDRAIVWLASFYLYGIPR